MSANTILDITTSKPAALGARYKMPPVATKVEGRGGATKTVITNCEVIASSLHTEPAYVMKFISLELGAALSGDKVNPHALKGNKPAADLQKVLTRFITGFVLCPTCKLPELKMTVDEKAQDLRIDCTACSHGGMLKTPHKLKAFIVKNPPAGKDKSTADAQRAARVDDLAAAADAQQDAAAGQGDKKSKGKGKKDDDDVEWFTDTSADAVKKRQAEELASLSAGAKAATGVDTKDAAPAKADDAKAPAAAEAGDAKAGAAAAAAADAKIEDPVAALRAFIAGGKTKRSADEIVSEWKRVCLARNLGSAASTDPALQAQRVSVMLQALWKYSDAAELKSIAVQAKEKTNVQTLRKSVASNETAQGVMLNVLEQLLSVTAPKLLPYTPHILQALYDADVVSEDAVLTWADSPAQANNLVKAEDAAKVRAKAKPFVEWLKTAEDDD